ncbi:hypothetical protein O181_113665 [Austropuccinia psidii MF-1]|uniref:Uncharacterized protein n=1 Tax=Austropuccinia psidii MF-1 TaxID=1389203 RepID=A0A9Q3PUR6_9BASI|nr:hypothetical protein [Austropuccinia psidii MF-1]
MAITHQRGPIGHKRYGVANWPQLGSRLELLQHPWRRVSNNGIIPAAPGPTLEEPFTPKEIPLEWPQRFPSWSPEKMGNLGNLREIWCFTMKLILILKELMRLTSTTNNEVIRSPQPPQLPIRSPTRPSTLASTSTSIQPPVASTSRDPMSPEPESIFETHYCWNSTANFTDQKR